MSRSPLRVALVSREYPPFYGGGIGTYARWIVPTLLDANVRVHVVTEAHDKHHGRVELDGGATVHRVPISAGLGGWTNATARFSINAGRKVAQLARTGQIDVAEFAECEAAGIASLMMRSAGKRVPTIIQLHTPSEQLFALRSLSSRSLDDSLIAYFELERLAMGLADEILAPSQFIANWAHEHYGLGTLPTVIPYATPPLRSAPSSAAKSDTMTVFYAGRIEPRKGVESLIHAWNSVIMRHPAARLRLAGGDTSGAPDGGSMRAYLPQLLDEHARGTVQFLGRLDSASLQDEYARAHLCVIPSLWENFPNTCIESMSSARAVLVGDSGGMREMIGETNAGQIFTAGDGHDLCDKMCSMLDEGAAGLADRGREARRQIERLCDPARIAGLRIEHYQSVISKAYKNEDTKSQIRKRAWLGLERVASGAEADIDLPIPSESVRRWVQRVEAAAC